MRTLSTSERDALLQERPKWRLEPGDAAITRAFEFADFDAAWAFMTQVAAAAARLDHHPDWSNSYNKVRITLTTHDAGGLTERDAALAAAIDDAL